MAMEKASPGQPRLLQGNEAVVEGAMYAGCRFFAGYPITPATEISEVMSWRLPAAGGTFIQMEDEIASLGAPAPLRSMRQSPSTRVGGLPVPRSECPAGSAASQDPAQS